MIDYLQKALTARVYDVAIESPLEKAARLSARLDNTLLLKREDLQSVFSFKLRGAYNKMAQLPPEALARGVVCASAGNHAQGVALAAKRLGTRAVVVMPLTTPQVKVQAVKARGGEVVLYGDAFDDAQAHARELERREGLTFVHPFDDPDVIAGQGTIGLEILRQHQGPLHAVFIAIGGGGLAAGVAACLKRVRPEVKIIGVEPVDAASMHRSLQEGRRVKLDYAGLFADGVAVREVGEETFRLCREYLDEVILVNTDAICAATKDVFDDTRAVLEPAGAVAVAGAKAWVERERITGQTLVAIACGANVNFDRLQFIAERANVGEHREAVLAVTIPEGPGSLKEFCVLVGRRSLTELAYRIAGTQRAHLFVGIQVQGRGEGARFAEYFNRQGFGALDLTDNEAARLHLRHLVGGRSPLAENEVLYRFEFPERPGALMQFLDSLPPRWNVSLFHYRNHGADYGHALVGLQVTDADKPALESCLKTLGYPYRDESDNPACKLFLRHADAR
ncbi:L-threonine dehydratase biosynthetic IlvA [Opitutaceae bacterium TAV5]|nr:L-threonine dehydratase biosynthetic IlvA [Opitutaceae bacterium TAV5]